MTDAEKTSEILIALTARASNLICATEPQLGAKLRRIDFWTLHPHEGKGHCATSYEIKVSRADFKRDSAMKQREARLYSDQFYYVTPVGLVSEDEIPDWAGLQEWDGAQFRFSIHAPKLSKSAPSWDFVTSLIRSSHFIRRDTSIEISELRGEISRLKWNMKRLKVDAAKKFITEIDQAELTVRLIEIGCKMRRPVGLSGRPALDNLRKNAPIPELIADFEAMALASIEYFGERISALQKVN